MNDLIDHEIGLVYRYLGHPNYDNTPEDANCWDALRSMIDALPGEEGWRPPTLLELRDLYLDSYYSSQYYALWQLSLFCKSKFTPLQDIFRKEHADKFEYGEANNSFISVWVPSVETDCSLIQEHREFAWEFAYKDVDDTEIWLSLIKNQDYREGKREPMKINPWDGIILCFAVRELPEHAVYAASKVDRLWEQLGYQVIRIDYTWQDPFSGLGYNTETRHEQPHPSVLKIRDRLVSEGDAAVESLPIEFLDQFDKSLPEYELPHWLADRSIFTWQGSWGPTIQFRWNERVVWESIAEILSRIDSEKSRRILGELRKRQPHVQRYLDDKWREENAETLLLEAEKRERRERLYHYVKVFLWIVAFISIFMILGFLKE